MTQQSLPFDLSSIESIAAERFGKTEFYREILDALNVAPFELPTGLLPEISTVSPEKLLNLQPILAKVDEVTRKVDQVLEDGTPKLKAAIEKISWLF